MNILAIETATEACSAALLSDDVIISRFQLAPREHTKLILPMMGEVLEEAGIDVNELDAVAFSQGPGAFTGLRIAAGVAQGVALSVNKPVIPVSTLAAIALQALLLDSSAEIIISALDARMGEVYWAVYKVKDGTVQLIDKENVSKPEDMLQAINVYQTKSIILAGIGWDAYKKSLFQKDKMPEYCHYIKQQYPKAEHIVTLAKQLFIDTQTVAAENAQPVYIRNKVAEKSVKTL